MAWLKIESSVSRNKKFVKAGPAPSWLWLCGLSYCQEGLTDGFIPTEALPYLGVKNAAQLASHLVKAGLWDPCDEGWRVHDYLKHNRSASQVEDIKATKKAHGRLGGRPKKNHTDNHDGFRPDNHMVSDGETHQVAVAVADAVADLELDKVRRIWGADAVRDLPEGPYDKWFPAFSAAYHPQGRVDNPMARQAFMAVFTKSHRDPKAIYDELIAAVHNHASGAQWVGGKVPRMDRWLLDGLYVQQHAPASTVAPVGGRPRPAWAPKVART